MTVRFVMGPAPLTRVRSSQQLTRDSNFPTTRKDALGAPKKVICRSPATRTSIVHGAMGNIIWHCVNQLELTGINLLEQIQLKKIQVREILSKEIPPSQKIYTCRFDAHVAAGLRSCQARLLFDSRPQRTFISQDLANKIGAQPFKKEELLMSTFGHDKRTKAESASWLMEKESSLMPWCPQ